MGKKTSTTKKAAAPAKRAAKPTNKTKRIAEPAVIVPPAKSVAPKTGASAAPKAPAPKPATTKRAPKPTAKAAPAYTQSDVSLRAYFIAEKRMAAGLPGDSHQDWIEAERQLMAEAAVMTKPKAKAKAAKA